MFQKVNVRACRQSKESSKLNNRREKWWWEHLGFTRANFGTLSESATVTCVRYSEILRGQLKRVIWTNCRGLLSKGVARSHDNASLHSAVHTVKAADNRAFRCWSILHMVLIWLLLTVIRLVHSKTLWGAAVSAVTKWKKRWVSELSLKQTRFSVHMEDWGPLD
jgi:hypothetical protein